MPSEVGAVRVRTGISSLVERLVMASGFVLLSAATGCARTGPAAADLVLLNGRITTMDPSRPEAQALAASGGKIVALGSDADIRRLVGTTTEVIDLAGRRAVPGFIEGHAHLLSLGRSRRTVDLRGARSWDEVVARVARAASNARPGAWIEGWGWHQESWDTSPVPAVEGYPVHDALSTATPNNPVLLKHASGSHAGMANALALARAGVGPSTPDPEGGRFLRDERGRVTGLLRETAYDVVWAAREADDARRPAAEREQDERAEVALAAEDCLAHGVTSFQDAGEPLQVIDLLRTMAGEHALPVRLYVMISEPDDTLEAAIDRYRIRGEGDDHLSVRAIKRQIDGALGTHGAWLLEPYHDLPSTSGLETEPVAEIERAARIASDHGFQLCVHAIGDRAVRETLDVYERVLREHPERTGLRWRVEHAQNVHPADVPRFAKLGVLASMQGVHCTSDGPWVPLRLGEDRAKERAYIWRTLLDAGATISNGTDAPIEPVDPIAGFHALITRRMKDGRAFHPEQCMTRDEALRASTVSAAYSAFEEDLKGSLSPGKLADVAVLDRDILTIPEEEIPGTQVDLTIIGGRIAWSRGAVPAR